MHEASIGTAVLIDLRRPPFRHHGRKVIAGFCGYELIALAPDSPVPTISEMVRRHPLLGLALLGLLAHHWFVELEDALECVEDAIGALVDAASPT